MIPILLDYATPSAFQSQRDRDQVGLSPDSRRPVRFHGKIVKSAFLLRIALRALGELVWSNDSWAGGSNLLDPIITVHPDRVFLEAFSQDQSVYGLVVLDPGLFEIQGEPVWGTTNVDFSAWLWAALAELRTSRETWLRIEPSGFEVKTSGAGGRFEKKVDLDLSWVRGFLNLQGAMAVPGTRFSARPVDILAGIRFLKHHKAKVAPRALRYELEPDQDARMILEPFEHAIVLQGASHQGDRPRTIRTWGRRRLGLIEPLLPFADRVDVYLKGRAQPSFYAVKLDGITFLLGLTGWSAQTWTGHDGHLLLLQGGELDDRKLDPALERLRTNFSCGTRELAEALGLPLAGAAGLLARLCRQGRAVYDLEARNYRHRELFEAPVDEAEVFPSSLRRDEAQALIRRKAVQVLESGPAPTRKTRRVRTMTGTRIEERIFQDWKITGRVGEFEPVEIVLSDRGRMIFGRCECDFFKENLLNLGPCPHMLALFESDETRAKGDDGEN